MEVKTARCSSPESLLQQFHSAASRGHLKDYFGCFHSSTSRFLGTDETEHWKADEFFAFTKPYFESGNGWTYLPRLNSRKFEQIDFEGNPQFLCFDELLDNTHFGVTLRGSGTMVYEKELSCWFIVSYHLTFAVPNDIGTEVCNVIKLFNKKNSNDKVNGSSSQNMDELVRKANEAAEELLSLEEMELDKKKKNKSKSKSKK